MHQTNKNRPNKQRNKSQRDKIQQLVSKVTNCQTNLIMVKKNGKLVIDSFIIDHKEGGRGDYLVNIVQAAPQIRFTRMILEILPGSNWYKRSEVDQLEAFGEFRSTLIQPSFGP